MTAAQDDTIAELQRANAELRRERDAAQFEKAALTEALARRHSEYGERIEQQAATSEVLKVMSTSPGNPQPVFDLIVRRGRELCNSQAAMIYEYDGELVHIRADDGAREVPGAADYFAAFPMKPIRGSFACRAILDNQIVHIRDVRAEQERAEVVKGVGIGSALAIPMLRDGAAIGAFIIDSIEVGGYSQSQVALLRTFAEQAVIAITSAETYRALQTRTSDLQESLEYQTATSDVLNVISRSAFDLQPVLDTVVMTAAKLCGAEMAAIGRREGDLFRVVAHLGLPPDFVADRQSRGAMRLDKNGVTGRAVLEGRVIHIQDAASEPDYPADAISVGKQRSSLGVPLLRDNEVIGVVLLARQRVEPFTDRQIDLIRTFADQAVIAIENTRLIAEQREALEQQTATAEVLQVINASPGNLSPVFEAILHKAHSLCGAAVGALAIYDGDFFRAIATLGYPEQHANLMREPYPPNHYHRQLLHGDRIVHIPDVKANDFNRDDEVGRSLREGTDVRTGLAVPLRKDGSLLGYISAFRREVRLFSEKEIALLENFAAQAVIAIENARLLTEQREALEQQTAMADVLQVINSSPGDHAPVFDAILEKALALCGADRGIIRTYDGEAFHMGAMRGIPTELAELMRAPRRPPFTGMALGRLVAGELVVELEDIANQAGYRAGAPTLRAMADAGGARTGLWVALRKDDVLLGLIWVYRQEVKPFTSNQVALLQNFAAQAVIAMENARLITEQREALEQQTATAEVLQVINASPGNLTPVFDAIMERSLTLCEAAFGSLCLYEDGHESYRAVAMHNLPDALAELFRDKRLGFLPESSFGRMARGESPIHVIDAAAAEAGLAASPMRRAAVEIGGAHTTLWVALRKDQRVLGAIVAWRREIKAFSPKQIALLENFAAQAAIAIENARLLDEIRQRQEELRVTFENMGDGVAMFDETQHLAAWNRRFQDILDVSDEVIARRQTFHEYVRYLADRGEYGAGPDVEEQVRRLIEQAGQSRTYERTRPDGRVIEIRHNPVPSGGFVLIFADITERKRNEAEIRAARDAAEAALVDLRRAQDRLVQSEKMASLGQLTAGIAHEIKNPLNFVNNFSDLSVDLLNELQEAVAPGKLVVADGLRAEIEDITTTLKGNLEKIAEHGKRADNIVKNMLLHSRTGPSEQRAIDVNATVEEALNLAYHGARAETPGFNITMEKDLDPKAGSIDAFPQEFLRVMLNLISNGFYAARKRANAIEDKSFEPTLHVTTRNLVSQVEIRVRDNGTGIGDEVRDKIFEPFFTTKPAGEGTGLGLSLSYDIIVKQHGGQLTVDSRPNDFTELQITLPRRMATSEGGRA